MLDFNTEPYNDDFDENNKFYRILFRPSFAVQARELTQLQTILQKQIEFNGSHIFKQGAMVIPGQASLDVKYNYVKLQQIYAGEDIETYINNLNGLTVIGASSGVTAQIIKIVHVEGNDPTTLYVRYTNSGTDNVTKVFQNGEVLTTSDDVYSVLVAASDATGIGSAATIQRGVYYVNGNYVLCDEQTIILDKYSNKPSYRIGLLVDEQKITPEDAGYEMLLDNAQNSFNYAAPGAHRYYIDLILTKLPLYTAARTWVSTKTFNFGDFIRSGNLYYKVTVGGLSGTIAPAVTTDTTNGDLSLQFVSSYDEATDTSSDQNFIQLITCGAGDIQKIINSTKYSEIEKSLATRTFDESGNYTVVPFKMDVREHRNNNRGPWTVGNNYLIGDVIISNGYTYVAKNSTTSVGTGTPKVGPSHTSGDAYDGVSSSGVYWEYNETPVYTRGYYSPEDGGDETKLALIMEPGSAYVQGYQIEKVAPEPVSIDKARDSIQTADSYIPAPVGNYVLVTNINSMPPFDSFAPINLLDRLTTSVGVTPTSANLVGTARVRAIEWHSGAIGTQAAIYKLFLFDVSLTTGKSFNRNVKSFFFSRSDTNLNFTADIKPVTTLLRGTATSGSIASPSSSETIVGAGTLFENDLTVNDYIYLDSTARRVKTITGDNAITVDGAITKTAANISLLTTEIVQPQYASLLYPIGNYAIKSMRDSNGDKQIIYYTTEYCSAIAGSDLGSTCELVINVPNGGVFASGDETDNYVIVYNDASSGGVIVAPVSFSAGGSSSITITLADTYAGKNMLVMATVRKIAADGREKTKTINTTTTSYTTKIAATKNTIILGKADVYRIRSVKMDATGTFDSPSGTYTIDITDRYDFDNGQRDTHYDLGRINLKQSYTVPSAPIRVEYEYFSHGTGDYFTLNSYTNIQYKDIPLYKGNPLRDYIDFRPRIEDAGVNFTGSGSSFAPPPKRGTDITADYSFYLSRNHKIGLDFQGNFFNLQGVSSITPTDPPNAATGMILYNISLEPYTFGTTSINVVVTKVENKRYTMRDIGALEKRIENIEYYTSLSLLEQDTKNLAIRDANGLDRFKNGFIVDNFTGHGIGNTDSPDYLCSIDMANNALRPFCVQNNVNLIEKNTNNTQRTSSNYKLYGDVITLPVVEDVILAQNQYASRLENINPFAVFTFLGNVKLNPSSDDWFEVDRRADIVHNIEGNYNTIAKLAEKAGVLGTVWNAWQDVWSGVPVVTGTRQTGWIGSTNGGMGIALWGTLTNYETSAQEIKQQRSGVTTTVKAKIDNQIVDDKILSTAIIPYARKRNVLVQVKSLKPNTRFYTYFDGTPVSSYCTPSSYLTYTLTTGIDFDSQTNSGGNSTEDARLIQNVSGSFNSDAAGNMALNIGDVVSDSNGATAVVVGKDYDADTGIRRLHVMNIKGTFENGHTITGSISGATATITSPIPSNLNQNDALISNFNGDINFLFWIQNNDELKFRTGTREFKLIDADTSAGQFTSSGRTNYSATGILQTKQRTVNAVRNGEIVQTEITNSQTIYRTSERVVSSSAAVIGWYDPLAQTFLVQSKGGAFLSKVDVFFATKDSKLPVNLEIREVVNGYPGQTVLPFSRVTLKPEQINISANMVTLTDGSDASYPKYDTPTTFTFPSPVYVQDNAEYAIVLASDSNKYKAWISQVGDKIPGSNRTISEQPYNGVLFKSQNASTWTADQTQDLKFTLWRARFDTSVIGDIKLHNDILPAKQLVLNPFEVVSGTNKVRVWQRDHGLFDGSSVTLSNTNTALTAGTAATGTIATAGTGTTTVTGTLFTTDIGAVGTSASGTVLYKTDGTFIGIVASVTSSTELELVANSSAVIVSSVSYKFAASINGIPVTEIYTSHVIANADLDSYVITTDTNATLSGYGGGSTVYATYNVLYDVIQPSIQVQTFPDTTLDSYLNTTTGKSIDGTETPYINYSANVDSNFNAVTLNDNNQFYYPCVIASQENEIDSALSGVKSVTLKCKISSTNDALSPIIDTHRASLILVSNKLNNPSETNINVAELDNRLLFTDNFAFSGSTITSSNSGVRDLMKTIIIGKYITIAGATTAGNDGTYLVTNLIDNGSSGIITVDRAFDTDESSNSVTTLTLRNLFVDEIGPTGGSVVNKYVSRVINLANPSTLLRITFAAYVPTESNVLVYYKTSPVASTLSFDQTPWSLLNPDTPLVKSEHTTSATPAYDVNFTASDLAQFDALAIKLVMVSTNSAAAPMIKDLRIIACA